MKQYVLFRPHFYVLISALTIVSQSGHKFSEKFFHRQNFYQYVTYSVRIWTYDNADEKTHTFPGRSKNVKKNRRKTDTVEIYVSYFSPYQYYEQLLKPQPDVESDKLAKQFEY